MAQLSLSKHIAAPPQLVFELATDLPHAAEHIQGIKEIELLTGEPVGVGTRWKETRTVMGREATEELEITQFDPPQAYTVECESCGAHYRTEFRFVPEGEATRVELDVSCRAVSFAAKLMSPLMNMMFGKMMRTCMEQDLEDLKRAAEQRAAAGVS